MKREQKQIIKLRKVVSGIQIKTKDKSYSVNELSDIFGRNPTQPMKDSQVASSLSKYFTRKSQNGYTDYEQRAIRYTHSAKALRLRENCD